MKNLQISNKNKRKIWKIVVPLLGTFLLFYFAFYMLSGERGLISLIKLKKQYKISQEELATVTNERAKLENKVKLLRDESLDKDILEERARVMLNYSKPNEIIIPLTTDSKPSSATIKDVNDASK